MSLKSILTGIPNNEGPYFPFPENPQKIEIEGREAYSYISEENLNQFIKNYSDHTDLNQFDLLLVNMNGGKFFADKLLSLQNYKGRIKNIGFHEDLSVSIPIPDNCEGLNIGVIDDILDKYITGSMIQKKLPDAKLMYMTKKRSVTTINEITNCTWAVEIDSKWVLGGGMNGDIPTDGYPKNWGRTYKGIAVKILE